MNKTIIKCVGGLLLALFASSAMATRIHLVPTSDINFLSNGDFVSFDIVANFSGDRASLGGGLDIVFDGTAVSFTSLVDAGVGDPQFSREPDVLTDLLESWSIGAMNGFNTDDTVIGSVEFQVQPGMDEKTVISIQGTDGIGGHWVSGIDFISVVNPNYNTIVLSRSVGPLSVKSGFESD